MSHERKFFLEEEQQKQWMLAYLHENLDPTQIDRVRRMVQSATVAVLEYNPALVRAKVHILDGKRDFIRHW